MQTELEQLKEAIESGDSCIEAYEQVDLVVMSSQGDSDVANRIQMVLQQVAFINQAAGIE